MILFDSSEYIKSILLKGHQKKNEENAYLKDNEYSKYYDEICYILNYVD